MMNFGIDFKNNQKQAKILIITLFAIGVILYFNFFLKPQLARLTDLLSKTGRLMSDFKTATSDIARIDNFKKEIEAHKEQMQTYENKLPTEYEKTHLLEILTNMAKTSNIKIISNDPIAAPPARNIAARRAYYIELPLRQIKAKSGYHEFGAFLDNIENADKFMKVSDIKITANKTTPKKHDVDIKVYTYILLGE